MKAIFLILLDLSNIVELFVYIVISLVIVVIIIALTYNVIKTTVLLLLEPLGMGMFSKYFKHNDENTRYAFAILGAHVVRADLDQLREQFLYMDGILRGLFPKIKPIERQEYLNLTKVYPDFDKPAEWCAMKLTEPRQIQLLDYLIDLAFHNPVLSRREMKLIYHIGKILGFPESEIGSMINIRHLRYEKAREHEQNRGDSNRSSSAHHKKMKALKVLGLPPPTTDFSEVRKSFRNLARKHHPDRFEQSSAEAQKMAHERFIEINLAHDYLKEVMEN